MREDRGDVNLAAVSRVKAPVRVSMSFFDISASRGAVRPVLNRARSSGETTCDSLTSHASTPAQMADFFVAQFLDEWTSSEQETKGPPRYNRRCLEVDFITVSSTPTLQCRGPAHPGDMKCRVADRLMNQHHNEFLRLRDWVELGEGRKLITDPHRLAHFMLRSREIVAAEVGACAPPTRLEHIKNPFLTPSQCRKCVVKNELSALNTRDKEVVETRRAQLLGALSGLKMRNGRTVDQTVAEIVCERLEKKTKRARE